MAKLFSVGCGTLPVLLLLLLVASVPVMALDVEPWVEFLEKVIPTFLREMKAPEEFTKGVKWGFKTCKILKKLQAEAEQQQNSGSGGSTTTSPDVATIQFYHTSSGVISGMRFPVVTADITATPAARHGFCGADMVGLDEDRLVSLRRDQMSNISLFGIRRDDTQTQRMLPIAPPFPGKVQVYYPAVATAPSLAIVGLGRGGELSKRFPTFTYLTRHDGGAVFRLPTAAAKQGRHLGESRSQLATVTIPLYTNPKYPRDGDGRYYVEATGIRVGDEVVQTTTELGFRPDGTGGVYLSTTEPYTYLESCVYLRLKAALMSQIEKLNHGAVPTSLDPAGKLCYMRTELMVPSMAILFAGGNAAMNLSAAANVWYRERPSTVCLAILPTNLSSPGQASVLGSWLQSGRMMTIDVTPGTSGTLTF